MEIEEAMDAMSDRLDEVSLPLTRKDYLELLSRLSIEVEERRELVRDELAALEA